MLVSRGVIHGAPSATVKSTFPGSGYGDVYGGKIKEGVYGMGGRVGGAFLATTENITLQISETELFSGNLGLVGGLGLGRRRREAALNTASASAGAVASGPDAFSMAVRSMHSKS